MKNDSQEGKSIVLSVPCSLIKRLSSSVVKTLIVFSTISSYTKTAVREKKELKAFLTFLYHIGTRLKNKVYICSPLETDALTKYKSDFKR